MCIGWRDRVFFNALAKFSKCFLIHSFTSPLGGLGFGAGGLGAGGLGAGGLCVTASTDTLAPLTAATIELTRVLMAKDMAANTLAIVMPCSQNKIRIFFSQRIIAV